MKIVKLGQQGLEVPAVGLGCMGMSEFYGQSDDTKSLKLLDEALEIGCNFWDTADMYGPFTNCFQCSFQCLSDQTNPLKIDEINVKKRAAKGLRIGFLMAKKWF